MQRFQTSPAVLIMALVAMLITGCAAFQTDLRVYDNLPDGIPKGYVEFYTEENEDAVKLNQDFPGSFFIYKIENGVETEIEGMVWSWRTKRRIAVEPGTNTFRIKYASADKKITVEAVEGMIVPVRVTFKRIGESYGVGYKKIGQKFNMYIVAEKVIPNV